MALKPLQIGDVYKNVDDAVINVHSAALVNGYRDALGAINKIPGLSLFVDLQQPYPVDGLFWWDAAGYLVVVCGGFMFKVFNVDGDFEYVPYSTDRIPNGPTSFASPSWPGPQIKYLYMAGRSGGPLNYFHSGFNLVKPLYLTDADAPLNCSHVVFIDQYILANEKGTGKFMWSDVGVHYSWTPTNYAYAETQPDDLVAMATGWRELVLVGSETIEVWYNDGDTPWTRLDGAFVEDGCIAPGSFKRVGLSWVWLNQKRQFVEMVDRVPVPISSPFDKYIQSLPTVSDAEAQVIEIGGHTFYVCVFPTSDKTIVYNATTKSWSEWGDWVNADYGFSRFRGGCYAYAKPWNLHLFGDPTTGKIYKMSDSTYDNCGDDMRLLLRTGHQDHGTMAKKRARRILIRAKRGVGNADVTDPKVAIRWKDDGRWWSNEIHPSMGKVGENEFLIQLDGLGMYRTRQYEISYSEKTPLVIVGAEEDVEIMGAGA